MIKFGKMQVNISINFLIFNHEIYLKLTILGSENEAAQKMNREKILSIADFIVPGHGPKFQVKKL